MIIFLLDSVFQLTGYLFVEQANTFECHAMTNEAKVTFEDDMEVVIVHLAFEVVVDTQGHLVSYHIVKTTVDLKNPNTMFSLIKKIKKGWNKFKGFIEEAVHALIQKKVTAIVEKIATSILEAA